MQRNDSRASRACQEEKSGSFASRYAHLRNGFVAVPSWFRATPFWRLLPGAHRAVLDEVFHSLARKPRRWTDANLEVRRGECFVGRYALARNAGVSDSQVRSALKKAEAAGILTKEPASVVVRGHQQPITRIRWIAFNAYDTPSTNGPGESPVEPPVKPTQNRQSKNAPDATQTGDSGQNPKAARQSEAHKIASQPASDINRIHEPSIHELKDLSNAPRSTPPSPKKRRPSAKPPPDPRIKVLIDGFCDAYKKAHGRAYVVSGAKDGKLLKQMLRALDAEKVDDPAAEIFKAAETMLADPWGKPNAGIGLLSSQFNKWRGGLQKPTPPGQKPSSSVGLPLYRGGVQQPGGTK